MTAAIDSLRAAIRDLVASRGLFVEIVRRDLLVRYKQTLIGVAWAFLVPVAGMLVFSMVFMRAAPVETDVPYPLFAYSGLLSWNLLASSLRTATTSLTLNHALVTKVPFPRAVLPLSAVAVSLVDFLVALILLGGLMAYYGVAPGVWVVAAPVVVVVQLAFVMALALLVSLANLFYRDAGYVVTLGLTLWMFATSVVYPVELVGGRLGAALAWNPMNPIVHAFRATVLDGEVPPTHVLAATAAGAFALLAVALIVFRRLEPRFAEAI